MRAWGLVAQVLSFITRRWKKGRGFLRLALPGQASLIEPPGPEVEAHEVEAHEEAALAVH